MSSLQALLNPMSSGPPSPVALVGSHFPSADEPPELDLDSDEPEPELDGVGDLVEVLQVEDDDETEDDEDIRMHGTGAPPPPQPTAMVVDDEEEEDDEDEDEEMHSPSRRQGRIPSTPPSDADSMETESAHIGSSPPAIHGDGDEYMNGVNGFYEEEEDEDEDEDAGATETDREASIPPLSKTPAPPLHTPEHETFEPRARVSSPAAAAYTPPPALVLTPSPPPEEQQQQRATPSPVIDMPTKPKPKKKAAAPKKKGQAASKKRTSTAGDFDFDEDSIAGGASPKKKTKKSGGGSKTKKKSVASSSLSGGGGGDDKTNVIGLPKFDENGEQLYCICRKPDTGKWMIACDGCEDWYHGECVNVKEADGDLIDKYYCKHCYSSTQQTTWKRMCRLPGCRRPAAIETTPTPSKYCTPQHGIEYMSKHVIPFSTFTRAQIAALANAAPNAAEFKRLGDRIPTPPPSAIHAYPEETRRLAEIAEERVALVAHQKRILQRGRYVLLAQERRVRIIEELKNDPEMGKITTICGFDTRLALDDAEWDEWCNEDEGREVFETGVIPGRDGVCLKKTCRTHKGWTVLFTEEQGKMERERLERVVALKQEERKIRERQKRRAVKDESEGLVELAV